MKKVYWIIITGIIIIGGFVMLQIFKPNTQMDLKKSIQSILSQSLSKGIVVNSHGIPFYHWALDTSGFNVTQENGLKISDYNWSVTIQADFVLQNDNVLKWADLPENINKSFWVEQEEYPIPKYKYGLTFCNVTEAQKDNIKYVNLTLENSENLTWDEVSQIGNSIIINKNNRIVEFSHDDILTDFTIEEINKNSILVGGLASNFIDSGDGTYCIDFDPTITLNGERIGIDSILTNVSMETGDSNFTHLNISTSPPYDDLVLYWSFDGDAKDTEGTTIYDITRYNKDGTYYNNAVANSSNGLFGNGAEFDGISDYIEIGNNPVGGSKNASFSFWAKGFLSDDNDPRLFDTNGVWMRIDTGGSDDIGVRVTDGVDLCGADSGIIFSYGAWHHLAVVFEANNELKFYLNGVEQSTGFPYNCSAVDFIEAGGNLRIGNEQPGTSRSFNGTIDEFMIFNTSLTEQQILDIYNNQSARFDQTGKQDLINQSYLNISSGNNKVNVTTVFDNNLNSNLSLFLGYYNSTGWFSTSPQNLTSGENASFTISSSSTNLTLNYTLIAGWNTTTSFYTPIVYDDIILNYYSEGVSDETPPYFQDISNQTIDNATALYYNINATDETSFGCFTVNDTTNFKINCTGMLENNTHLAVQVYRINITINDSSNNLNSSIMQVNVTEAVTDTCTCPGLNNNWEINHEDSCVINDNCDLGTGTLSFTGTGTTKCNATINTTDLGDPGDGGILSMLKDCIINTLPLILLK